MAGTGRDTVGSIPTLATVGQVGPQGESDMQTVYGSDVQSRWHSGGQVVFPDTATLEEVNEGIKAVAKALDDKNLEPWRTEDYEPAPARVPGGLTQYEWDRRKPLVEGVHVYLNAGCC